MSQNDIKGMFEGPILPVTWRLGMPIIIGNLSNFLFVLVDTYFVSLIDHGSTAVLSGVSLIDPVFFCFMALSIGVQTGVSSMVGRGVGERNRDLLEQIPSGSFLLAVTIGLPSLFAVYWFNQEFVELLAGAQLSAEAIEHGRDYLLGVFPGIVLMIFLQMYMGILGGEGKTKIIGSSAVLFTVLNIVLDPVFIFGFALGTLGAGIATTVSMAVSLVYILIYYRKHSDLPLDIAPERARWASISRILYIAVPQFFAIASTGFVVLIFNKLVGQVSESAMNAWAMVCRMDGFILLPLLGISSCTLPMIAQNFGRGQLSRVREILLKNIAFGLALYAAVSITYIVFSPVVFSLLSPYSEVVDIAVRQVRYLAVFLSILAVTMVSSSAFLGVGKPAYPFIISYTHVVIATIMGYLLVEKYQLGMLGVIYAIMTGMVCQLVMASILIKTKFFKLKFESTGQV